MIWLKVYMGGYDYFNLRCISPVMHPSDGVVGTIETVHQQLKN